MAVHVFVDEIKSKGYVLAAAALLPTDLGKARKTVTSLVKSRQRRVHFSSESEPRRKQILDVVLGLSPEVVLYDSSRHPRRRQRDACLEALIDDLAARNAQMLTVERDDSVLEVDRKLLYRRVREAGCADTLTYRHQRGHEEPLLAIPDAIAWCWNRGGQWKKRVDPVVTGVRHL